MKKKFLQNLDLTNRTFWENKIADSLLSCIINFSLQKSKWYNIHNKTTITICSTEVSFSITLNYVINDASMSIIICICKVGNLEYEPYNEKRTFWYLYGTKYRHFVLGISEHPSRIPPDYDQHYSYRIYIHGYFTNGTRRNLIQLKYYLTINIFLLWFLFLWKRVSHTHVSNKLNCFCKADKVALLSHKCLDDYWIYISLQMFQKFK